MEAIEWIVWPWAEDRLVRRFVTAGLVLLATATLYLYSQNLLLALTVVMVLLISLADYFFPLKYTLTGEGLKRLSLWGTRFVKAGAELHRDGEKVFFGTMRVFLPRQKEKEIMEVLERVGRPAGVEGRRSGRDD